MDLRGGLWQHQPPGGGRVLCRSAAGDDGNAPEPFHPGDLRNERRFRARRSVQRLGGCPGDARGSSRLGRFHRRAGRPDPEAGREPGRGQAAAFSRRGGGPAGEFRRRLRHRQRAVCNRGSERRRLPGRVRHFRSLPAVGTISARVSLWGDP